MSETVLKFAVDEVTVIRVVCRHCGVATEAPLGQFGQVLTDGDCPTCKKSLLPTNANGRQTLLKELEDALKRLAGVKNDARVEFVLPAKSAGGP